ncbi:hypothetical protein MARPO_0075s0033 [Marchantia polymorpha]|uniref:Uncharacterized protein n=2 Tax=Marchantia polymorpha TaxID=3197 RepID=A0A2R6WM29_MARPO|nr:hypothetical protein MARPO_0075s0033 [Marchantia polymorpha]|eukprot:PTQ34909.1 hypothetical protein MARPO_0075s0033 [Marchantia polymorpha]
MGRKKSKGWKGSDSVENREPNVIKSTEALNLTKLENGNSVDEQTASLAADKLILRIAEYRMASDDQKASVSREDSLLTLVEYRKAVGKATEAVERLAQVSGKNGAVLSSTLRRLLFSRQNSPLHLWWTYAAAEKYTHLETNADPLLQGASILDFVGKLLISMKALSAVNTSGNLAVAAMAPIVALLHDAVTLLHKSVGSLKGKVRDPDSLDGRKTRNLVRKMKATIREILSFIVVCHRRDLPEYRIVTTLPSAEHIALKSVECVQPAFPLASKHMMKILNRDSLNSAVLAEVVSVEVILLQALVETIDWRSRCKKQMKVPSIGHEFAEKIKSLARYSICTGSTFSPPEMLLDMLLEKRLPVGDLMDDKEEKIVRECIIEAVLVDPPEFGLFELTSQKNVDSNNVLFMKKLAVGRRAIQLFRAQDDRMRADTISRRIASWVTPPQLMKWLQVQKRHLLPVTALLGSQAFLNWVASTSDEIAFKSIFDRCVTAFTPVVVYNDANGECKGDDLDMEDEDEEDLFFVDTAGQAKEESLDIAADLAFTAAAKDIKEGKTSGKREKERGPIYSRLPHAAIGSDKKVKKIVAELEESNSDSDSDAEDPNMVEDDSSAEDPALAEDSSSDDEPIVNLVVDEVEQSKKKRKNSRKSSKESDEKVEKEAVANPVNPPTVKEDAKGTKGKDEEMLEAVGVPTDPLVLSKDELCGNENADRMVDRMVESTLLPVPKIQSSNKQDKQVTGRKDHEKIDAQLGCSEANPNSVLPLVEEMPEGFVQGSTEQVECGAVPGPNLSHVSEGDPDQEMVEASSGVSALRKPPVDRKSRSKQDLEVRGDKDPITVEMVMTSASEAAEIGEETAVGSSSKSLKRSKRSRKDGAEKNPDALDAMNSPTAVESANEFTLLKSPLSALGISSETSSKSKRGKKDTTNKDTETGDSVPSTPTPTNQKEVKLMETPPTVVVTSSGTSSKSKRGKKVIVDTETVNSEPSELPICAEDPEKQEAAPPVTLADSVETSRKTKRGKVKGIETMEKVDSGSPAIIGFDSGIQNAALANASDQSLMQSSERGKVSSANVDTETVETVISAPPVNSEKDVDLQVLSPPSTTSSKSKRGKQAYASKQTETVETLVSAVPVTTEKDFETQVASPLSITSETPSTKSKRGKKASANKESEAAETVISAVPLTSENDFERQVASPISITAETSSKSKRGRKSAANKDAESLENVDVAAHAAIEDDALTEARSPSPFASDEPSGKSKRGKKATGNKLPDTLPVASHVQMGELETQESIPQPKLVDSNKVPSDLEGGSEVATDMDAEVVPGKLAVAGIDAKAVDSLLSQATSGTVQRTQELAIAVPTSSELTGMTQASAERDVETMANVPSSSSPTSRKGKRGRKPKAKLSALESEGDLPPVLPTPRRIATRGTTPHIVVEKVEDKLEEDDEAPIVLVTPHKTPRKSRKKVTLQEPQEKASEDVKVPASVPALYSTEEQGKLKASSDSGASAPPTSVQQTPSRGRKRSKAQVISEDEFEDSPTTSVQATPSRGRPKGSRVRVVTDDETDDTPTPSVQATPTRGRPKSLKAKVVTDDETDDTPSHSVQATPTRGRPKGSKARVVIDDDTDETSTLAVQATPNRSKKSSKAKVVDDDEVFEDLSSPSDQGTHVRGRKSSRSADADEWVPPSATKTPRKKTRASSQPPEEDQEMGDRSGSIPVFIPRRSKRGSASSQVEGESLDMALSPYRSSKKKKSTLPVIVDLEDDE